MARINNDFGYSTGAGLQREDKVIDPISGQGFLPVIRGDGGHPFRPIHQKAPDRDTGLPSKRIDILRDASWLAWDSKTQKPISYLDSSDNLYFQHQLTLFLNEVDRVEYREVNARNIIPTLFVNQPGMLRWEYMQVEGYGKAEITSTNSNDMPVVNVTGRPFSNEVRELRLGAKFSRQELIRAQFANRMGPISNDIYREKLEYARLGLLMLEQEIAWFGNADYQLKGYLSEGTGIGKEPNQGQKLQDQTSPADMFSILNTGVTKIASTEGERPNTLGLGTRAFLAVNQKITGLNNDMTVGQAFIQGSPWIEEIVWIPQLGFRQDLYVELAKTMPLAEAERLAGGIKKQDVMLTWHRDPSRSRLIVAQDLVMTPPTINDAQETTVAQFLYTGGLEIKRPRAHHILVNV